MALEVMIAIKLLLTVVEMRNRCRGKRLGKNIMFNVACILQFKDENSEFISKACALGEELVSRNISNKIFHDQAQP
jgi:hypothetical protein